MSLVSILLVFSLGAMSLFSSFILAKPWMQCLAFIFAILEFTGVVFMALAWDLAR
jgi:hypothetical protein